MKKRVINYIKKWDDKGYVYDQTVKITSKEFTDINEYILELPDSFIEALSCEKRSYAVPLISINNICFTSHTLRNIVSDFLKIEIKDRNTIFEIVD